MSYTNKTSLLIPSQLPEFIRDNPDYANFVLFLKAYYEWLESPDAANTLSSSVNTNNQGVGYASKNLLNYSDVDQTIDGFLDYFVNDFLPYFPQDALVDKRTATKVARQLYKSKGTPASYEFLFKILYNSTFDYFNTGDAVLKASSGKWYIPKSLRLNSISPYFASLINTSGTYKVFGETSKAIATIENVVQTSNRTELFLSQNERGFQSGEYVRIVDADLQDILFGGSVLRAKIVGQVGSVTIDSNNPGNFYQVGDPVVLIGGLSSNTGLGATAVVGSATSGGITSVGVSGGGYGYRATPNSQIYFTNLNAGSVPPVATVATLDPTAAKQANIVLVPINTLAPGKLWRTIGSTTLGNTFPANTSANVNCTLANAFTFSSINTSPIASVLVSYGGSGITTTPQAAANSRYITDTGYQDLSYLGILSPIQISNGGGWYQVNDIIRIVGGTGQGANAKVTSIGSNGAVTGVAYQTYANNKINSYPPGGLGYSPYNLPVATIQSQNTRASGAVLTIPGILGTGASFLSTSDRTGTITSITITDPGQDYQSTPSVSLKVQDLLISGSGLSTTTLPQKGEVIYQGTDFATATYYATVDSITTYSSGYILRVYDYSSTTIDNTSPFNIVNEATQFYLGYNDYYGYLLTVPSSRYIKGVLTYGDGTALATATILNGIVSGNGQYIGTEGQPSSYSILQSDNFNTYTYEISVQKEIAKYKNILLNLLHPSGLKVLGKYTTESSNDFTVDLHETHTFSNTLYHFTSVTSSNVTMYSDFTNYSNNIIKFNNLSGATLSSFVNVNTRITMTSSTGQNVSAKVISVNNNANTAVIDSNVWLTFGNVASARSNSGSSNLNIVGLTGTYDIINNGKYSYPTNPLRDIVYSGDTVLYNGTQYVVNYVDYSSGVINLTTTVGTTTTGNISVRRTFSAGGTVGTVNDIRIYTTQYGVQYFAYLTTENFDILLAEDGNELLIT